MGWGLESLWPYRLGPQKPAFRVDSSHISVELRLCHFLASVPTHLQTFPGVELWFQTMCESSELPAPHRSSVHGSNVTLGSI